MAKTLFITPGEPAEQIRKNAEALDFDPNSIVFLDLSPTLAILRRGADSTISSQPSGSGTRTDD